MFQNAGCTPMKSEQLQKSGCEVMKFAAKRPMRDEKGQALLATLLLLLIGSLIVTPTLHFMGTGVSSGRVYEQKIDEIYAADSGVEDALWHIRNDLVEDLLGGDYDEYDYSTPNPYPYNLSVNGKDVAVSIQNIWIPKDISTPTLSEAKQIIEDENLIIVGYPSSTASTYTIKIVYNWEDSTKRDALRVKTIGIWLSPGFEYTEYSGSCSLQSRPFYSAPTISLYKGGTAVVWNFANPRLRQDFTPTNDTSNPLVRTFTFKYTSPEAGQIPELVSSWVDTTGVTGITYSWDDSIRLYKIVSQAGGVQIEAYGAKTKFRKLKSTISSDYAVAGNTLMQATGTGQIPGCAYPENYYRDRLYAESDSTIQSIGIEEIPESGIVPAGYIPEEAIIDKVYLYWTGWIDYHYWYKYTYYGHDYYYWGEIPALKYPNSPTQANLKTLVETNAKVNQVKFAVGGSAQTVTADNWQTARTSDCYGATSSWAYSCFKDVTNVVVSGGMTVQEYIENAMKSEGSGTVTFTEGHADEVRNQSRPGYASYYFNLYGDGSTGYPLATPAHKRPDQQCYEFEYNYTYAGWSLIIFYRSPAVAQRQLYLYDDFIKATTNPPNPTEVPFTISGFLAPPVISEYDTSHLTYFVGEGDPHFVDSYLSVNDKYVSDPPTNPENNVFNSQSNAIPVTASDGIDVDTFEMPEGAILPYDASAEITLTTTNEIYFLVYLVLSFRSDLTTGGIITNYTVKIS
jgi:hypothetical protein